MIQALLTIDDILSAFAGRFAESRSTVCKAGFCLILISLQYERSAARRKTMIIYDRK